MEGMKMKAEEMAEAARRLRVLREQEVAEAMVDGTIRPNRALRRAQGDRVKRGLMIRGVRP